MDKRFHYKLISQLIVVCVGLWLSTVYAATTVVLPNFTTLVEKYGPAVVNISTTHKVDEEDGGSPLSPDDVPPPFQEFFKRFLDEERGGGIPREYDVRSLGSGFIISDDGYVVTNNHVIRDADQVVVRLVDQREFVAKVIGSDAGSDLALLKIDAKNLPKVSFGKSADLKVGEWVLAIGSPFGFEHSATAGIVSAKGRSLRTERYVPFIQTDVAINPGNSGGPLFNLNGEVVGINSQILSRTGGYIGLSFAVPSDVAIDVIAQLKSGGHVSRGWLGVYFQEMDRDLAESFGLENSQGALVAKVMPGGPAAKGGLQPGDVIVAVNGKKIAQAAELPPLIGNMKPGTHINVELIRQGKTHQTSLVVGELPKENSAKESSRRKEKITNRLGVTVRDLKEEERIQFEMKNSPGVIIENVGRGPANNVGLQPGDIILTIGNTPVRTAKDFTTIIASLPVNKSVPFLVVRPGQGEKYITLKLTK